MREHAKLFGSSRSLVGIVTAPDSKPVADSVAVVLLNAGVVHRVGPNRLYVTLARRLAESGFIVLRFDHSGIGDSLPREDTLPFEQSAIVEAQEAMDLLEAEEGCNRFILVGMCSGTLTAFRTAYRDQRVVGAALLTALLEDPASVREETITDAHNRKVARSLLTHKLFNGKSWIRFLTGEADYHRVFQITSSTLLKRFKLRRDVSSGARQVLAQLDELTTRGVGLQFIYSEGTVVFEYFRMTLAAKIPNLPGADNIEVNVLKQAGHTFTGLAHQARVIELIYKWASSRFAGAGDPRELL